LTEEKKMGGLVYSGKFEQTVNEHFNQKNIAATAKKFKDMEQKTRALFLWSDDEADGAEAG
jgi:hypothetical protein